MTDALVKAAVESGALFLVSLLLIRVFGEKLDALTSQVTRLHEKIAVMLDRTGASATTPKPMEKVR